MRDFTKVASDVGNVFMQNFRFSHSRREDFLEIDESSEEQSMFCGRPNCFSERAQFALFGLTQILLSTAIFAATFSEKNKGLNIKAVLQMSDEFTLWANSLLFINGLSNLFLGNWAQRLNVLNHQVQAALLPATIFLAISMKIGTQYLGVHMVDMDHDLGITAVQHVPSVAVAYAASRMHGMKTSEAFKQPSVLFFAIRALFATQYILRDAIEHYAGYHEFDFFQDGVFNSKELGLILGCFAANVFLMNVITYGIARTLESSVSCFQETTLFKKHCSQDEDVEEGQMELSSGGPKVSISFTDLGF